MSQELRVDITGNSKGLQKATKEADKTLGNFNNNLKNIAGSLAAAFGTREVLAFGKRAVEAAGKVEGVRKAFEKLNGANLDDLRRATAGTVSDLELMQKANLASKLGLDVKNLGSLFAFAAKTAQETGQSVDYLSQSIVTGIGRKSALILDNLGISAIQLKEALGGVSLEAASVAQVTEAVGKIAAESMGDASGVVETTEIKTARLNAAWENLTATFGTRAAPAYEKLLDFLTTAVEGLEQLYLTSGQLSMRLGSGLGGNIVADIFGQTKDIEERKRLLNEAIAEQKRLRDEQANLASNLEQSSGVGRDFTDWLGLTTDQAEQASDKVGEYTGIIEALQEALTQLESQEALDNTVVKTEEVDKIMEAFNKKMRVFNHQWTLFGETDSEGTINAIKSAMIALTEEGSQPAIEKVQELQAKLDALQKMARNTETMTGQYKIAREKPNVLTGKKAVGTEMQGQVYGEIQQATDKLAQFRELSEAVGFTWENLGVQFTQVFTGMLENGTLTFKGLMLALIKMITKMTIALITATALRSVMGDASAGPRALSAAASIGSAIGSLAAAGIPAMAEGGVVTSPTLALIGEGRQNEAVIPLDKLDSMMQNGGGGGRTSELVLRGQDLYAAITRAEGFKTRFG